MIQGLFSPLARIPGPWHTRFTGFVCQWHRLRGTKMKWAHDLSLQYGSVVRISPVEVAAFDPALWEDINRMGSGFRKTAFHDQLRIGSDHMLFSIVDVKRHAKRRRLFARALTMDTIRRNWEAKIRTKVERAIKEIRSEADHTGTADVCKWWRLLAGDVIALMSFGESFDLVENGATMREGEGNAYFRALENAGINIVLSSLVPLLGFWAWLLPFQSLKDIASANDVVAEKGDVAVRNLKKKGLEKPNLFTNMLTEAAKAGEDGTAESLDLTDSVIRAEAAGFLLAGSDTTGTALTYMVWAVLNKPDLQRRMEDEMAKLPHDFTDKDLEGLPLLNNVLDEVLRLHSPAAGNILRKTPSQGVTWHGYLIPGGTSVMTQQYTMIRNPGLFPDPERYAPTTLPFSHVIRISPDDPC